MNNQSQESQISTFHKTFDDPGQNSDPLFQAFHVQDVRTLWVLCVIFTKAPFSNA